MRWQFGASGEFGLRRLLGGRLASLKAGLLVALVVFVSLLAAVPAGAETLLGPGGLGGVADIFPFRAEADAVIARQIETLLLPPAVRGLVTEPRLTTAGYEDDSLASTVLTVAGAAGLLSSVAPEADTELGRLNLAQGRFDEARSRLDAALRRNSQDVRALVGRGLLAALTGDNQRANEIIDRAAVVARQDREVRYLSLAWTVARGVVREPATAGGAQSLASDVQAYASQIPANLSGFYAAYGALLEAVNRPAEARQAYSKGLSLNSRDAIMLDLLANLDFGAHDWSAARAGWSKVLEIEPRFHPARLGLAQALAGLSRTREAIEALDPTRFEYDEAHLGVALTLLAQLERETGLQREASLHALAALELNPGNYLAKAIYETGERRNAATRDDALAYLSRVRRAEFASAGYPPVQTQGIVVAPGAARLIAGDGSEYLTDYRTTVRIVAGDDIQRIVGFWLMPSRGRAEWRRLGVGPVPFELDGKNSQEITGYLVYADGEYVRFSTRVIWDRTPPSGYIAINNGERITGDRRVSLYVYATDPEGRVTGMSFSQDDWNWSEWEPLSDRREIVLDGRDGVCTVSARFRDQVGNISTPVKASITLDTTPPRIYGVQVTDVGFHAARVSWYTSEPARSRVRIDSGSHDSGGWLYPGVFLPASGSGPGVYTVRSGLGIGTQMNSAGSGAGFGIGAMGIAIEPGSDSYPQGDEVDMDLATSHAVIVEGLESGISYYFRIFAMDAAGNQAPPAEAVIRTSVDSEPPRGGFTINDGEREVMNPRVVLHLWANDRESGVGGVRMSADGSRWTEWRPFEPAVEFRLPDGDGQKTIYVQYRDNAGNTSETYRAAITLDTRPLRISAVHVSEITATSAVLTWTTNEPATSTVMYWRSGEARWDLSVDQTRDQARDPNWAQRPDARDGWEWERQRVRNDRVTTSHRVVLTNLAPDSEYTYEITCRDNSGDEEAAGPFRFRTEPRPDRVPPVGRVVINNGAPVTSRPDVVLYLSATDDSGGPVTISLSNDGYTWSRWEPLVSSKNWRIEGQDGQKVVRVRFRDQAGNVGEATASVQLDTAPPRVIDARVESAGPDTATFTWTTTEMTTGSVTCNLGRETWTGNDDRLARDHRVVIRGLRPRTTYVWSVTAVDGLGRKITAGPYQFQTAAPRDTTPPRGTITINGGAPSTETEDVTLQVSAVDDSGGPVAICLSNDQANWTRWESVSPVKPWRLSAGFGPKTVYARFRDEAGNESEARAAIRLERNALRIIQARVENVTPTSAVFSWVTDAPAAGRVVCTARGESRRVDDNQMTPQHRVVVEGLRPQTAYSWTIFATDQRGVTVTYEGGSFTTPPLTPSQPPQPPTKPTFPPTQPWPPAQPPTPPSGPPSQPPSGPPAPPPGPQPPTGAPVNMALKGSGAQISSSSSPNNHPASGANDGNLKTVWQPENDNRGTADEWLMVSLARPVRILYVRVRGDINAREVVARIQYDAGGRWVDAGVLPAKADRLELGGKVVTSRVRLLLTRADSKDHGPLRAQVQELEVWGTPQVP